MAIRGQRFELDLGADDFAFKPSAEAEDDYDASIPSVIKEIREHDSHEPPEPPKLKQTKSGFPEHRPRRNISTFKQKQQSAQDLIDAKKVLPQGPSDRAIAHQLGTKPGYEPNVAERADISQENKQKIAQMSHEAIEKARADLLQTLNPAFVERLLKRANIEEDQQDSLQDVPSRAPVVDEQEVAQKTAASSKEVEKKINHTGQTETESHRSATHFPIPPRSAEDYVPLDPNSATFLDDLRTHYFPETPHDPSMLAWLQDPTPEEEEDSTYNPEKPSYAASSLRFGFNGRLIPPKESLKIGASEGLHHHGEAPSSAGYTLPELAILCRSTLPSQRCIAYQTIGRILYRLGRGDFGPRGTELQEALWSEVEKERILEMVMAAANREGGHVSARAYATEALWLWRKAGGGDRGILKPSEKLAK